MPGVVVGRKQGVALVRVLQPLDPVLVLGKPPGVPETGGNNGQPLPVMLREHARGGQNRGVVDTNG